MGSTAEILANKHYPLYYVAIHENDDPPVIVCLSVCARASLLFSKSVQFDPSGTKVFFLLFGWWDFFFFFFYSVEKNYSIFYIVIVTMPSIRCGCWVPGNPSQPI
jgi:hypothetical protein